MKKTDLTGCKFDNLLVLKKTEFRSKSRNILYLCQCEACGKNDCYISSSYLNLKKGFIKSCGCLNNKIGSENSRWKGYGEISGDFWNRSILRNLKSRGDRRKFLGVSITIEYAWDLFLKQDRKCALSGVPLVISNKRDVNLASIDRIDSNIGYHEGNIQWVHKDLNNMKQSYNQDYFIFLCKKVSETFKEEQ